jgi:hypothetical protein
MASAGLAAERLAAMLPERSRAGLSDSWERRFHADVLRHLRDPWFISTRQELLDVGGSPKIVTEARLAVLRCFPKTVPFDASLAETLSQVVQMRRPIDEFLRPSVIARALVVLALVRIRGRRAPLSEVPKKVDPPRRTATRVVPLEGEAG